MYPSSVLAGTRVIFSQDFPDFPNSSLAHFFLFMRISWLIFKVFPHFNIFSRVLWLTIRSYRISILYPLNIVYILYTVNSPVIVRFSSTLNSFECEGKSYLVLETFTRQKHLVLEKKFKILSPPPLYTLVLFKPSGSFHFKSYQSIKQIYFPNLIHQNKQNKNRAIIPLLFASFIMLQTFF